MFRLTDADSLLKLKLKLASSHSLPHVTARKTDLLIPIAKVTKVTHSVNVPHILNNTS